MGKISGNFMYAVFAFDCVCVGVCVCVCVWVCVCVAGLNTQCVNGQYKRRKLEIGIKGRDESCVLEKKTYLNIWPQIECQTLNYNN